MTKLPPAPPWARNGWMWQSVEGQWWSRISQLSPLGGMVPSWASLAEPAKSIVSPTANWRLLLGELIVTVGAELAVAEVVKLQLTSAASGLPARSLTPFAPPVTVAV